MNIILDRLVKVICFLHKKNTLQNGHNSIRYKGAKIWNEIPVELRDSHSIASFKTKAKIYFLCHNYTQ